MICSSATQLLRRLCLCLLVVTLLSGIALWAQPEMPQDSNQVVGSLHSPRTGHTATLLPNGRVLIVGGWDGSEELASIELYDPKQKLFVPGANMSMARNEHTATLLRNGQVLVVGGQCHGNTLATAELYNPATDTWSVTGSLHLARSYHTATLLPNGQVLVVGGARMASPPVYAQGAPPGSALDIAEVYDPSSGKWTVTDNLNTARYLHTATLLPNGKVLVAGGLGKGGMNDALASAELYDPGTRSWRVTGGLSRTLFNHVAVALSNEQVLVTGGQCNGIILSSAESYNVSNETWAQAGNLPEVLNGHTATLLPDDQVLVIGGANNDRTLTNVEFYHPSTHTWETTNSLDSVRFLHTATLLPNGEILLVGGCYAAGSPTYVLASAELYTPAAPQESASSPSLAVNVPTHSTSTSTLADTTSSLLTFATGLFVVTCCLVILTACVVILLAVWLVFLLARRWNK